MFERIEVIEELLDTNPSWVDVHLAVFCSEFRACLDPKFGVVKHHRITVPLK